MCFIEHLNSIINSKNPLVSGKYAIWVHAPNEQWFSSNSIRRLIERQVVITSDVNFPKLLVCWIEIRSTRWFSNVEGLECAVAHVLWTLTFPEAFQPKVICSSTQFFQNLDWLRYRDLNLNLFPSWFYRILFKTFHCSPLIQQDLSVRSFTTVI